MQAVRIRRQPSMLSAFGTVLALLALGASCSGGDADDGGDPPTAYSLECSSAAASQPNAITIGCPGATVGVIGIEVILGGPTTSTDIYGIKFDVVFDEDVLRFQAPAVEGSFLNQGGASTVLEAGTPGVDHGRLVVALSRQGATSGAQGAVRAERLLTAFFTGASPGSTVLSFENVEVVDSSLSPIPGIQALGTATIQVR